MTRILQNPQNRKYLIFIGFFLLSILIRLPHLNRPLSKHHEYCTAHVLITLDIWQKEGASNFFYSSVLTYGGENDLGLDNLTMGIVQRDGRYYYLSFAPFGFILPYFAFSTLGISPSPLALQAFNLFFHLISTYLIYLILGQIFEWKKKELFLPGLVGALFYLFSPATLWFHSNGYMSDLFVSNYLIAGIWLTLPIFISDNHITLGRVLALGFLIFFMIYTAWMGCLFAFIVFCKALWDSRKNRKYLSVALVCVLGVLGALALTVWQYSLIDGFATVVNYLENRFMDRSFVERTSIFKMLFYIARSHLITGFFPILIWLFAGAAAYFYTTKSLKFKRNKPFSIFLLLAGLPIMAHHIIFVEYTAAHDFGVLKTGVLFSVLGGALYYKLQQKTKSYLLPISILTCILLCISQYYVINRPGPINQNGDPYTYMQEIGHTIKENASEDEVVFMTGYKPSPQILYYAKRNIARAANVIDAKKILIERGAKNGVLFSIEGKKVGSIQHFSTE